MDTELENLLNWIEEHRWRVQPYIEGIHIEHKAIWGAKVMGNIAQAIKKGEPVAIELGCEVVSQDQKYPFGKLIKSNLARALKGQVKYINKKQRSGILEVVCKLLNMEFTPRETEDYCRLASKFPETEVKSAIQLISPRTESAEKWVGYLQNAANK